MNKTFNFTDKIFIETEFNFWLTDRENFAQKIQVSINLEQKITIGGRSTGLNIGYKLSNALDKNLIEKLVNSCFRIEAIDCKEENGISTDFYFENDRGIKVFIGNSKVYPDLSNKVNEYLTWIKDMSEEAKKVINESIENLALLRKCVYVFEDASTNIKSTRRIELK